MQLSVREEALVAVRPVQCERGLADAAGAADHHQARAARSERCGEHRGQLSELLAAGAERPGCGGQLAWSFQVGEQALVQLSGLRIRIDTELVGEAVPQRRVHPQGVALPAIRRERAHELPDHAFVVRVFLGQFPRGCLHGCVFAPLESCVVQVEHDREVLGDQCGPLVFQPGHSGERLTPPQRQGLFRLAIGDERTELVHVDGLGRDLQDVPVQAPGDRHVTGQGRPQPVHVGLESLIGLPR